MLAGVLAVGWCRARYTHITTTAIDLATFETVTVSTHTFGDATLSQHELDRRPTLISEALAAKDIETGMTGFQVGLRKIRSLVILPMPHLCEVSTHPPAMGILGWENSLELAEIIEQRGRQAMPVLRLLVQQVQQHAQFDLAHLDAMVMEHPEAFGELRPAGQRMPNQSVGYALATWGFLLGAALSMLAGLLLRELAVIHGIAIVLSLIYAVVKIVYDPDPPALMAPIAFPLFFLLLARLAYGIGLGVEKLMSALRRKTA